MGRPFAAYDWATKRTRYLYVEVGRREDVERCWEKCEKEAQGPTSHADGQRKTGAPSVAALGAGAADGM
eukprot:1200413-Alexandrium_andersonii.AAC.1